MDNYRPHPRANFEGWYTRFTTDAGSLILIACSLRGLQKASPELKSAVVHVRFVSADGNIKVADFWPKSVESVATADGVEFSANFEQGTFKASVAGDVSKFTLETESLRVHATVSSHRPWSDASPLDGPEGWLARLPLPLHWHVLSTWSPCTVDMAWDGTTLTSQGHAHLEKNWADGFPVAHVWMQGADVHGSVTVAGGQTLGLDAYLAGYRAPGYAVDFRPPWTVGLAPLAQGVLGPWAPRLAGVLAPLLSPLATLTRDYTGKAIGLRCITVALDGWRPVLYRLDVRGTAPAASFFTFAAPYPHAGFVDDWMAESLSGTLRAELSELQLRVPAGAGAKTEAAGGIGWLPWRWHTVSRQVFDQAGIEFGGEFYDERGRVPTGSSLDDGRPKGQKKKASAGNKAKQA